MRNLMIGILIFLCILGGVVVFNCLNNNLQTINKIDVQRCYEDMQKDPSLVCD